MQTLIAQGRTAELYDWQPGQVLKLFFTWCPRDWVERELVVNQKLASSSLPVPRLLEVVEVEGRSGLIFERVKGVTALHLATSQPWRLFSMARLLAELHAAMHKLQLPDLVPVRASLQATIERVEQLSDAQKAAVLSRLEQLPDGDSLCHFDFHPDQVMMTRDGPVILDWMTAHRGDPAADVARTAIILGIGRAPGQRRRQRILLNLARGLFQRHYLQRYLTLNPEVTLAHVQAWTLPVAAARLRENIENETPSLLKLVSSRLVR